MIDVDTYGKFSVLTLKREKALNAMNLELMGELIKKLEEQSKKVAVVITGSGKSFIAGADIREMKNFAPREAEEFSVLGNRIMDLLEDSDFVSIAAVNGYALGGGFEVVHACNLAIAGRSAIFAQPEIDLGICPGWGGIKRLERSLGYKKALELIVTGRRISADEALSMGLINRISDDPVEEAKTLAREIAAKPPYAIRYIKELLKRDDRSVKLFSMCFGEEEQKKLMSRF